MLNGADNLIAGGRSAITGEYTRSFGEAAIHHYVQNDLAQICCTRARNSAWDMREYERIGHYGQHDYPD